MKALIKSINLETNYSLDTIKMPVTIYLKITGACDLKCSFCSQSTEKKCSIPIDSAKNLLYELKECGVVSINYTGGEPLIYKDIDELLRYGNELGFNQTLVTNGTHLYDKKNILDYVDTVGISLHGNKKTHDALCGKKGTYDIVTKNIDRLLKEHKNIRVLINYTLSKRSINDQDINHVLNFCMQRNIELCFGRLNYIGSSTNADIIMPDVYLEKIDELQSKYKKISMSNCVIPCRTSKKYEYLCHSCGAGQTIYAIEANGDVKICPSSTYVLGNVFNNKFSKIINSKEIRDFKSLKWLPMVCTLCKKFPVCKGGCHAEGNKLFFNNTCDALLLSRFNEAWEEIKDKKLIVDNYLIRKDNKDYLIMKIPIRKINNTGYKLLLQLTGEKSAEEIVNCNSNISNIKEFIITLYLDELIKVI